MKLDLQPGEVLSIEMYEDIGPVTLLSGARWGRAPLNKKLLQERPDVAIEEGIARCRMLFTGLADMTT